MGQRTSLGQNYSGADKYSGMEFNSMRESSYWGSDTLRQKPFVVYIFSEAET